jgi:preprotein translocase subunit SecG
MAEPKGSTKVSILSPTTNLFKASASSILTRTRAFERLSKWSFTVCDSDETGQIGKAELYAGILLVHINLAKYAGAAACYPPSRHVVDDLFLSADKDLSGYIEENEFLEIIKVCSVDIASRIVVYYSILILLVPYLADAIVYVLFHVDDWMGVDMGERQLAVFAWIEDLISWKALAEQTVSLALFFLVIPLLFNFIDRNSKQRAHSKTKSP